MYEEKFRLYSGRCVRAKLLQLCLTLCDPMNCSPPGSSGHGIHQARILEWVAPEEFALPRGRIHISHIASKFFTDEPLGKPILEAKNLQL